MLNASKALVVSLMDVNVIKDGLGTTVINVYQHPIAYMVAVKTLLSVIVCLVGLERNVTYVSFFVIYFCY